MILRRKAVLFLLGLAILTANGSCKPESDDAAFRSAVASPIGNLVELQSMVGTSIRRGTTIPLLLRNTTQDCIVFPYNFGVQLLVAEGSTWTSIRDRSGFTTSDEIILSRAGTLDDNGFTYVNPDYSAIPAQSAATKMRVVVVGDACVNGSPSGRKVASYIEVTIQP